MILPAPLSYCLPGLFGLVNEIVLDPFLDPRCCPYLHVPDLDLNGFHLRNLLDEVLSGAMVASDYFSHCLVLQFSKSLHGLWDCVGVC